MQSDTVDLKAWASIASIHAFCHYLLSTGPFRCKLKVVLCCSKDLRALREAINTDAEGTDI